MTSTPSKLDPLELKNWRAVLAIQVGDPRRQLHLAGTVEASGEARVSSEIVDFDVSTMSGHTQSGRRYVLLGEPGLDHAGRDALKQWAWQIGATPEDVSDSLESVAADLGSAAAL